jgi:ferredoxin-NADP reductase
VTAPERSCHLFYEVRAGDDSPIASQNFKVVLDEGEIAGVTDANGQFHIDRIPPDDYLLEIGDVRMFVNAFSRDEGFRVIMAISDPA